MSVSQLSCDLAVLGSGAAGLTAALSAADAGLRVVVLEAADTLGGTTATSGGVLWAPCNHRARAAGVVDDLDTAAGYALGVADGHADVPLLHRWLEQAPMMVADVERSAEFAFSCLDAYPDYHPELSGGRAGGRSLDNPLFDTTALGEDAARLRRNPFNGKAPMTIAEAMSWNVFANPMGYPIRDVYARYKAGVVHGGTALIGRLMLALRSRGVPLLTGHRATSLDVVDQRVRGVQVESPTGPMHVSAEAGVVLATGGFEWDTARVGQWLECPNALPATPPTCRGDALAMTASLGVALGSVGDAWWCPVVEVPGESLEGHPLVRCEFGARCLPHSLMVNDRGRRFVNEAHSYHAMTRAMFHYDPVRACTPNNPAWLVCDARFVAKYLLITRLPGAPAPDWMTEAPTIEALAEAIGVPAGPLAATVERFNRQADAGVDDDFGRGDSAFDRLYGDHAHGPNPNLGALREGPFVALPVRAGTLGTRGGPRVDEHARVRLERGGVMDGLYAAGNAMASVTGGGYPGAGTTISCAMTFGWLAGRHAAGGTRS